MPFNKVDHYGASENILDSAVGLVVKTKQATQAMADDGKMIKAGTLLSETETTYEAVSAPGSENPTENGWYELVEGEYVLSDDASPQAETTYYEKKTSTECIGIVFDDYDMTDYTEYPIAVVVQGRLKADKVSAEALAQKEAFAAQGLYLV